MSVSLEKELPAITSIWSSFGHRFASTDSEDSEQCMTCGGMWTLARRADDPNAGDYTASNGDDPQECSRDTSRAHGYPGERYCQWGDCDDSEPCEHTAHDCNCLFCA